jgi:hypothetical protein
MVSDLCLSPAHINQHANTLLHSRLSLWPTIRRRHCRRQWYHAVRSAITAERSSHASCVMPADRDPAGCCKFKNIHVHERPYPTPHASVQPSRASAALSTARIARASAAQVLTASLHGSRASAYLPAPAPTPMFGVHSTEEIIHRTRTHD